MTEEKNNKSQPKEESRCDEEQYKLLKECSADKDMTPWNEWRDENKSEEIWLQGANLRNANLQGADLREAKLKGADLWIANLQGADLYNANLQEANLYNANLQEANFWGANLQEANLWIANLQEANLWKANLQGADLREAKLKGADLWGANLQGANLYNANLQGADLWEANLQGADLRVAKLQGANLLEAKLQGANLCNANLQEANFRNANLQEANLWIANLQGADLREAKLQGANLWGANLRGADLWVANLQGADLREAKLKGANLWGANLRGADLWIANLQGADLREANLQGANLYNANLQEANLRRAELQGAKLMGAIVNDSTSFLDCKIDESTDFRHMGLENICIESGTKYLLKYNIRRLNWEDWYKKNDKPILSYVPGNVLFNAILKKPVKWFWDISDYGTSTGRVVATFFSLAIIFSITYFRWPDMVIFNNEIGVNQFQSIWHAFYFSVVTMTTLGFGDIAANPNSWQGQGLLMLQVILGYVLLGALVTRLTVLFTADSPAGNYTPMDEKTRALLTKLKEDKKKAR